MNGKMFWLEEKDIENENVVILQNVNDKWLKKLAAVILYYMT